MLIFKMQIVVLAHFIKLATQRAAKQRMTKCYPQKSLSNNTISVVRGLPPYGKQVIPGLWSALGLLYYFAPKRPQLDCLHTQMSVKVLCHNQVIECPTGLGILMAPSS